MKPGGPCPPEHRPTPMAHTPPATQLQLQAAMQALVDVLNHSDDALRAGVIRELEQRTGLTVRTAEQEVALRRVARLADVEADKGMAEEISLEDAGWKGRQPAVRGQLAVRARGRSASRPCT